MSGFPRAFRLGLGPRSAANQQTRAKRAPADQRAGRVGLGFRRRAPAGLASLALAVWLWGLARPARADRQHIVRPGQSLAIIAKRYGLTASELAAANGLGSEVNLHGGQVLTVPPRGVVYVGRGETLIAIAKAHHVRVAALVKVNRLQPGAPLQIGQKLVLPGSKLSKAEAAAARRWGTPKTPGVVTLYRIWSREKRRMRLVDWRGRVQRGVQRRLRELLRPRNSRRRKLPNRRLLALLAKVSDHFGGRTIHVISGYRLPRGLTRKTSRHVAGEAIDFRIPGVPLTVLRDYCSHFDHVGVGYYPRTHFVHLDVRRSSARWTDWSLAGQPAILHKPADLEDDGSDGADAPVPDEADIPEPPPAPDDGQPPFDDQADDQPRARAARQPSG